MFLSSLVREQNTTHIETVTYMSEMTGMAEGGLRTKTITIFGPPTP